MEIQPDYVMIASVKFIVFYFGVQKFNFSEGIIMLRTFLFSNTNQSCDSSYDNNMKKFYLL